ncbi:MAG: tetratricopeptide repeat protein [Phycisphaerales bacterium]
MGESVDNSVSSTGRSWRELWQVPTLAVASVLLVAGLATLTLTRPKPDVAGMVERASGLVLDHRPEQALEILNDRARPFLNESYVSRETRQRFHAVRAAAIFRGQRLLGVDDPVNHERVVDEYAKARAFGYEPVDADLLLEAESLLALRRYTEARDAIAALSEAASMERVRLQRLTIEAAFAADPPRDELASELLNELATDPGLSVDDRAWTVARRTEQRLRDGFIDEAIARLLRVMPRVETASDAARGELFLLLGEAYAASGAIPDAEKQLSRATELLEPGDAVYARALLTEGRVLEQSGRPVEARERFERIVASYTTTPSYLPALVSLGEVLSLLAETDPTMASDADAISAYSRFVDEVQAGEPSSDVVASGTASMLSRFEEQMVREQLEEASQYAQLAEDLTGLSAAPADVLLSQARVNRALAEQLLRDVAGEPEPGEVPDLSRLDSTTRAQAQRWFVRSGDYFRRHADELAGGSDDVAYADSVWSAATMFDRGGDTAEAIASYIEFAGTIAGDPRVPAARFRLGRAYQASGEYELAAAQYEDLLETALDPDRGRGVGPYAVMSYVPLAETYLEDPDPSNDERASDLLQAVLRGEAGDVDSEAFGDALAAMGMVHYYDGRYPSAIEQLEEAVARETDARELNKIRYLLADSYRLEAMAIGETLGEGAIAPSMARDLEATREAHLSRSIELFAQVRDGLEEVDARRLTVLDRIYLRNSYFYLGDCAFDLRDFETAIRYYQIAKDRYADDAASLVAMVQIFNAYFEMGEVELAQTASEKARRFYDRLPEDAWDDPTLPMSRADWERWLDSSYELASIRSASAGE